MVNAKYLLSFGLVASGGVLASAAEITLFATGVNPDDASTYYNIQQGGNPTCWVATASNVIAHWQDHNAPKNAVSPEGIPAPQGEDVYRKYLSLYTDYGTTGGSSTSYYEYWLGYHSGYALSGYPPAKNSNGENILDTAEGLGGFYEKYYTEKVVDDIAWKWGLKADNASSGYYKEDLSKALYQTLLAGNAAVLDIADTRHALTLWGATFDTETNLLTKVWVTDSSGWAFDKSRLSGVNVQTGGYKMVLEGANYHYTTIDNAHFLGVSVTDTLAFIQSGTAIPEPSSFGLLAGLAALGFGACARRRRHR